MNLRQSIADPNQFLSLYSTVPPRASSPPEKVDAALDRFVTRMRGLELDGIVVYDVQDEHERIGDERPFPFLPTLPSRSYAERMRERVDAEMVTYKCVAGMSEDDWSAWLDNAAISGLRVVTPVGRASSRAAVVGISLTRALQIAKEHSAEFTLGGVVIPERHDAAHSESARLMRKAELGSSYFISQAVYSPDITIEVIRDYARACAERDVAPGRIVLTFTPCGYEKTLEFMRWLGIRIPDESARRILSAGSPIAESQAICAENFLRIGDAVRGLGVPIGVNVESVSVRKDEIDGSIELHGQLVAAARERLGFG